MPPLNLVGDFGGGGLLLAFGIVSAVLEARCSGRGQVVDAAMTDGSALLLTMLYGARNAGLWTTERGTNLLDGGAPFYDVYATSDELAVAVGCLEEQFYAELLRVLELDGAELGDYRDPASWPGIRATLRETFARRTRAEWSRPRLSEACFAPVLDIDEAPSHPHNRARETFYDTGDGALPAPAPRFERTPPALPGGRRRPAPTRSPPWRPGASRRRRSAPSSPRAWRTPERRPPSRPPHTPPQSDLGTSSAVVVRRFDVEAEHHPALVMLGDMAVRHPDARLGHVEQDVDGLAGPDEDGVLPDEVLLGAPSRESTTKRPAPWTWNGWCIGGPSPSRSPAAA